MDRHRLRDLVVLLPGIGGSVLQRDGNDVWKSSFGALWQLIKSRGGSLQDLAIEQDDPERPFLDDGVRATGLARDIHVIPGLVKIDMYTAISRLVTKHFKVYPGTVDERRPANFIEFPYDWRRDNRASARRLRDLVEDRLALWREESRNEDAKVVLIAHSMGGLVSRYYLEVLGGWRDCRALVTIGTPHRGSVDALDYLCNGFKKGPLDLSDMMRSFHSVHQLLPIYPVVEVGDEWYRITETPDALPGVQSELAHDAKQFHEEIKHGVSQRPEDAYPLIPIVGTRQRTRQSAQWAGRNVSTSYEVPGYFPEEMRDGDGTVPRVSATPIDLDGKFRETFLSEKHSSLQSHGGLLDDLRARLVQMQVPRAAPIQGPGPSSQPSTGPAVSVEVGDIFLHDEPVDVSAQLENVEGDRQVYAGVEGAGQSRTVELEPGPDAYETSLEGLPAGTYRLEVGTRTRGVGDPTPVHDVFEVLAP